MSRRTTLPMIVSAVLVATSVALAPGTPAALAAVPPADATSKADPGFTPAQRESDLRAARVAAASTGSELGLAVGERLRPVDALRDTDGATHLRYQRTYRGLAVVGGDLVVHRDARGSVSGVDYANQRSIALRSTTPRRAAPAAGATLVVFASGHRPVLAWETRTRAVARDGDPVDRLTYTSAATGSRLASWNQVVTVDGSGNSLYSGAVTLSTVLSGSTYQLTDATRGSSSVYDANNSTSSSRGTLFTDADNVWGNGTTSSRQSAAVDAAYGAQNTWDFYQSSFGRNGIRNDGVAAYSRVHYGSNYENAFWSDACFCMTYGDGGTTFSSLVSLDVAGHEMSHGVTSNTAGLNYTGEPGGLNEATSDIFGTMVEFGASNSNDPGDYYIGEEIARDGTFLRRMDNPSVDGGSVGCWYSGVGNLDVHYSSGVGNHFFYLLAEGSGSKTIGGRAHNGTLCAGPAVEGIGRSDAAQVWYRALTTYMTSTTNYRGARDATIQAARDLFGATSTQCATVTAAWNAVAVPVSAETCTTTTPPPTGNLLVNPGFESGGTGWSASSGVISTGAGSAPRTGSYVAWLDGYGVPHTDVLTQTVAIPADKASATLSFYLRINSTETSSTAYDTLKVQVTQGAATATLLTYSNVNKGGGYRKRTVSLSGYIGQTVTIRFLGVEDSGLATSFRIDDTALTTT